MRRAIGILVLGIALGFSTTVVRADVFVDTSPNVTSFGIVASNGSVLTEGFCRPHGRISSPAGNETQTGGGNDFRNRSLGAQADAKELKGEMK